MKAILPLVRVNGRSNLTKIQNFDNSCKTAKTNYPMAVQSDRKVKIDKNSQFSKVYHNRWNLRIILRIVFYSFYIPKIF